MTWLAGILIGGGLGLGVGIAIGFVRRRRDAPDAAEDPR